MQVHEFRNVRTVCEILGIRLGAVFRFDSRGVRIRLARVWIQVARRSDSAWSLDKQMLRASGFGFPASCCRLRAVASCFKLRFGCHGPGPKCKHKLCAPAASNRNANYVRTSLVKAIEFRTAREICMHPAFASA